jgi:hypothetical protein
MDNYFKMCPAVMSDGRIFTDYRTATAREQHNKATKNLVRDDEYRLYLQGSGKNIINDEWSQNVKNYCFPNVCLHTNPTRSSTELDIKELRNYNNVRTGKTAASLYKCKAEQDYRVTN